MAHGSNVIWTAQSLTARAPTYASRPMRLTATSRRLIPGPRAAPTRAQSEASEGLARPKAGPGIATRPGLGSGSDRLPTAGFHRRSPSEIGRPRCTADRPAIRSCAYRRPMSQICPAAADRRTERRTPCSWPSPHHRQVQDRGSADIPTIRVCRRRPIQGRRCHVRLVGVSHARVTWNQQRPRTRMPAPSPERVYGFPGSACRESPCPRSRAVADRLSRPCRTCFVEPSACPSSAAPDSRRQRIPSDRRSVSRRRWVRLRQSCRGVSRAASEAGAGD